MCSYFSLSLHGFYKKANIENIIIVKTIHYLVISIWAPKLTVRQIIHLKYNYNFFSKNVKLHLAVSIIIK